jgi:hypothetical protein
MSPNEWAVLILTILGIAGALFKSLQWLIRVEMRGIKHELSNNGGSSVKDKVDANTSDIKELKSNQSLVMMQQERILHLLMEGTHHDSEGCANCPA